MASLARSRQGHPWVRAAWADILGAIQPRDTYDEGRMLRTWLAGHFQFQADPVGVGVLGNVEDIELLRDPVLMLQQIRDSYTAFGDCDDAAILASALALAAPVPFSSVRYVLAGLDPSLPFTHVYAEVLTARGWLDLDVTRGAQANLSEIRKRGVLYV